MKLKIVHPFENYLMGPLRITVLKYLYTIFNSIIQFLN